MNMKNATILFIFFLSILGLLVGVYYSEDVCSDSSHKFAWERIYENHDGVLTVSLEKKEMDNLDRFFTWVFLLQNHCILN